MVESGPEAGDTPVGGSRRPARSPRSAQPEPSPGFGSDARDGWPTSIRPALEKAPDSACPWLYLHADPDARASFVTADHRCEIRPDEVPGPGHQLAYCLSTNHISCPQLRSYEAGRRPNPEDARTRVASPSVTAEERQPALAEFRSSVINGPAAARLGARRSGLAASRIAWAAAGAVGALIFAAGIALYSAPDNVSSDSNTQPASHPQATSQTPDPTSPLAAVPPTTTPTLTPEAFGTVTTEAASASDRPATNGPTTSGVVPATGPDAEDFTPTATPTPEPVQQTYVVGLGDTLGQIAQNLGIGVVELAAANDMTTATVIYAGDVLLLPLPVDESPTATPASSTDESGVPTN